nr:hypothetical protein [uncultured Caldimonas sp.]
MEQTGEPEAKEKERVAALAQSLDCFTEDDFILLAKITPGTASAWRKRGKGPAYVLMGNAFLYPRDAVREFISHCVRAPKKAPAKDLL